MAVLRRTSMRRVAFFLATVGALTFVFVSVARPHAALESPENSRGNVNIPSLTSKQVTRAPRRSLAQLQSRTESNCIGLPSEYFPTHIEGLGTPDAEVQFCKLDFAAYHANPPRFPMFRDLDTHSCNPANVKRCGVSAPPNDQGSAGKPRGVSLGRPSVRVCVPRGTVRFNDGSKPSCVRCRLCECTGVLMSENLVFSESAALPAIVTHCPACSDERKVQLIR